jgi:hypothetical protein
LFQHDSEGARELAVPTIVMLREHDELWRTLDIDSERPEVGRISRKPQDAAGRSRARVDSL